MANWVYSFENRVFTIVGYEVKQKLISQYPNLFFTRDPEPDDLSNHFPTVYMNFSSVDETNDLVNDDIDFINSSISVEVTGNKTQGPNGTRLVAYMVMEEIKKLGYRIYAMPKVMITGNDTTVMVLEARRLVGNGEKEI